jgi:hypothetical protein
MILTIMACVDWDGLIVRILSPAKKVQAECRLKGIFAANKQAGYLGTECLNIPITKVVFVASPWVTAFSTPPPPPTLTQ